MIHPQYPLPWNYSCLYTASMRNTGSKVQNASLLFVKLQCCKQCWSLSVCLFCRISPSNTYTHHRQCYPPYSDREHHWGLPLLQHCSTCHWYPHLFFTWPGPPHNHMVSGVWRKHYPNPLWSLRLLHTSVFQWHKEQGTFERCVSEQERLSRHTKLEIKQQQAALFLHNREWNSEQGSLRNTDCPLCRLVYVCVLLYVDVIENVM